jgi:cyclin-dependent kinase-like
VSFAVLHMQGELVDGEPLFPGESDIDQLYRVQQMLGPMILEHRVMFEMHPQHRGMNFYLTEPQTLAQRYAGKVSQEELNFLEGLLALDPKKRMTGVDCLRHPYLRDLTRLDDEVAYLIA